MAEKHKFKILIVDDDKFLLDMYSMKFQESGFDVTASFGATEALEKMETGLHPDIILTDVLMPVMDGFEFLEALKKKHLASDACVVVLSNLGQKEDADRGLALGAKGYIVKATRTPSEVVEEVRKMTKEHGVCAA